MTIGKMGQMFQYQVLMGYKYQINAEKDSNKTSVGSSIICCYENCEVKAPILASSYDVWSCLYQISDFTFESLKARNYTTKWNRM